MDLVGIGMLIISIAFALISIFLVKALNNLAKVLNGVNKTVDQLPEQLDSVFKETTSVIHNSNDTLEDVNEKIRALSPLFYLVGDIGETSRKFSSSLVDMTASMRQKTREGEKKVGQEGFRGIYGAVAFVYYLKQRRKELQSVQLESQT